MLSMFHVVSCSLTVCDMLRAACRWHSTEEQEQQRRYAVGIADGCIAM